MSIVLKHGLHPIGLFYVMCKKHQFPESINLSYPQDVTPSGYTVPTAFFVLSGLFKNPRHSGRKISWEKSLQCTVGCCFPCAAAGEAAPKGQWVISSYLPDIDVGAVDCYEDKDPDNLILPASNCYCPIYFIFPSKRKDLAGWWEQKDTAWTRISKQIPIKTSKK